MFKHKLQTLLYCLIVVVTVSTFCGYANTNSIVVTQTTLVPIKAKPTSSCVTYTIALQDLLQTNYYTTVCGFSFYKYLLANNKTITLTIRFQQMVYTTFKTKHLKLFYKALQDLDNSYLLLF